MRRAKHCKDYNSKKTVKNWQGWEHPSNKQNRSVIKNMEEIPNGSYYQKIGTWFEYN